MDDKTKLFVFARKEVYLILAFILLLVTTSFIFGVKIGKNFSYQKAGITPQDKARVEFLSGQEEAVEEIVSKQKQKDVELKKDGATDQEQNKGKRKNIEQHSFQKLKEKIEKDINGQDVPKDVQGSSYQEAQRLNQEKLKKKVIKADSVDSQSKNGKSLAKELERQNVGPGDVAKSKKKDRFSGKLTIQLGSHRTLADAEKFADGFRIRGYNPIINEVHIRRRGVWYRVSLGVFDSVAEAKNYIVKEKSLFQGQDYVIGKFD